MSQGQNHRLWINAAAFIIVLGVGAFTSPINAQEQPADATAATASPRAKLILKLKSIVIDKVDFNKADIATVVDFLSKKSKELDPEKKGINFVLRLPDAPNSNAPQIKIHREVSMTLDNIPLMDLLQAISEQTNLQVSVEDYAVFLHPAN